AAGHGDSATVAELLTKAPDVDVREGAWGQTPLMWAAAYNRVAAMDLLLKKGAGIEAASKIEDIPKQERELRTIMAGRTSSVAALKAAESPMASTTVTPNTTPAAPAAAAAAAAPARGAAPAAAPAAAPTRGAAPAAAPARGAAQAAGAR